MDSSVAAGGEELLRYMNDLERVDDLLTIVAQSGQEGFGRVDGGWGITINPPAQGDKYDRTVVLANELGHAHDAMVTKRDSPWFATGRTDLRLENDVRSIKGCSHGRRASSTLVESEPPSDQRDREAAVLQHSFVKLAQRAPTAPKRLAQRE